MTDLTLPKTIQSILDTDGRLDSIFSALLPALGKVLQCDRCFLYLRNPQTKFGKIVYCWRQNHQIPDVTYTEWQLEPAWLPQKDPLFAAALRAEPSIYIEDVETASPNILNKEFERKSFGHRALIHGHLSQDGQLWGTLEPCVFGHPRIWSDFDRAVFSQVTSQLTPLVVAYVQDNSSL